jgi:hypothetical protein
VSIIEKLGSLYRCKYCGCIKWYPIEPNDLWAMQSNFKLLGPKAGYNKLLLSKPTVFKAILALMKNRRSGHTGVVK